MAAPIIPILLGAGVIAFVALGGKKSAATATPPPPPAKTPGTPGYAAPGYTAPGIVPPAGVPAIPPEWGLPGGVSAPPTPAPGSVPFPGSTTGPSTALPDAGVAGLPEPLKSTTVIAMTNAKTVEDANALDGLALELDRMGQHKAAFEVRTRSNEIRSGTSVSGMVGAPFLRVAPAIAHTVAPARYGTTAPVALAPYSAEARARDWGFTRGVADARSNRSFSPDGAVASSDILRDAEKLRWPPALITRAIAFLRVGYAQGYHSIAGGI